MQQAEVNSRYTTRRIVKCATSLSLDSHTSMRCSRIHPSTLNTIRNKKRQKTSSDWNESVSLRKSASVSSKKPTRVRKKK